MISEQLSVAAMRMLCRALVGLGGLSLCYSIMLNIVPIMAKSIISQLFFV